MALPSCTDEVDLFNRDNPSQLFIYGILDCSGTGQEIKIRQTDLPDSAGSIVPEEFMNIPADSFSIQVREWKDVDYETFSFHPVAYPKDSGGFPYKRNPIYQSLFEPHDFTTYEMVVKNLRTHDEYTAETLPLADPKIIEPRLHSDEYLFSDTLQPLKVSYAPVPRGFVYRIEILIKYLEILNPDDTLFQTGSFGLSCHFLDTPPEYKPQTINYGLTTTRLLPVDYLLNIFARTIKIRQEVKMRKLHSLDFLVWAGNEDLSNYLRISQNFYDNRRQFLTNINNALGLFAACSHAEVTEVRPDYGFMVRLNDSDKTAQLKFSIDLYRGEFKKTGLAYLPFGLQDESLAVNDE